MGSESTGKSDSSHVDDILLELNPTGRYQVVHFILFGLLIPATAYQLMSNVFTAQQVPHQCSGPPVGSNWSHVFPKQLTNATVTVRQGSHVFPDDLTNTSMNVSQGSHVFHDDLTNATMTARQGSHVFHDDLTNTTMTVRQDQCEIVLLDNDSRVLDKTDCVFGHEYLVPVDSSARAQFDLVCDLTWLASISQTTVILGQGIGAILTTIASDRYGRKIVMVISNCGLLVCGLGIAYSPDVYIFILFKFLVGFAQQGAVTSAITLLIELFPTTNRGVSAWGTGILWSLSLISFSFISFLLQNHSWRTVQTCYSLVSILVIFQIWYLDESLRWLLVNQKLDKAAKVIKRIARMNSRSCDNILKKIDVRVRLVQKGNENSSVDTERTYNTVVARSLSFMDIFKIRRLFLNALCLWLGWFTTAISFFTIYLTATALYGNPYVNFALTAFMEIPSNIFFYFFLNRLGRRRNMQIMFGTVGIGISLAGIFKQLEKGNPSLSICTTLLTLISMSGASGCFTILYTYTPEMFPTNLRNQAVGVSSFMGRVGGMLAPFAGQLSEQAVWAPGLVCGGLGTLMCLLVRFLPETSWRELPQTVEELHSWFKIDQQDKRQDKRNIQESSLSHSALL